MHAQHQRLAFFLEIVDKTPVIGRGQFTHMPFDVFLNQSEAAGSVLTHHIQVVTGRIDI